MEALIWGGSALLSSVIVGLYWVSFRRRLRRDRQRLEEAQAQGFDRPRGQYPHIDASHCIGCGSCVAACPEGDVLGLVGGLAAVVNGARCIGIALCEQVCPVGAIEVALGPIKGRTDLPVLDEERQTTVPGIYIAGELGGLSLVANAISQGRDTVRQIASELPARGSAADPDLLDVAIVGAGPSGLAAALAAEEEQLSYVLLEQAEDFGGTIFHYPRRKLVHTQPVDLPLYGSLEKGEHSKEELLELFEGLHQKFRLEICFGRQITAVVRSEACLRVEAGEESWAARRVILAMGRRGTPRKLGVPGEELPKVMYEVRDADLYRHQKILCVGGGDSAVEAAMGLGRQAGNEVLLSYRRESFGRIKRLNQDRLEEAIRTGGLRPLLPSTLLAIEEDCVHLKQGDEEITLDNDFVFIFAGGLPPFGLLKEMGIRFGDEI